ncbi:MAG: hypothetical protein NTZ55_04435, partial [Candidatus Roizmanbacteria bacterium]|nr:hypothetical protein [Candidatus Roizmanbacteria bacterium]
MNIGKKQKELRIVVFIFYFLLSLLSFVAIIAIGLGVMMVFWQLNFGQELPTEYIDNLEMPSYIFIAIGVYLTMRKFTLKSTVFDHSYRDIRKYIEYIKKAIIYPSLVIFSRMKLTIIYFVYFLLLLLASFLINQIWVSFYKERSIAN